MGRKLSLKAKEILADDIDGSFVPRRRPEVVGVEVDDEAVLLVEGTRDLHALNGIGTVVWDLCDGTSTLDDIVADLAEAFGADPDVIRNDVVGLARGLGRAGLLVGVKREDPPPPQHQTPQGIPPGTEIEPFTYPTLDGDPVTLADLRGKRFMLVNWSPRCGFCVKIAPDLAELEPKLSKQEVGLVLLTIGEVDENRALLQDHGLHGTVLLQDAGYAPFAGVGTPAAYLIDDAGRIEGELALGALEVPDLAREAAGPDGRGRGRGSGSVR